MKIKYPACIYAEQLLNFQELSEFDLQVSEQYMPLIAQHYHATLLNSEIARDYLERKFGIGDTDITNYQLGFSDRSLGLQLPRYTSEEGQMLRGSLARLKVFKGTGHEAFRGCITVPVYHDSELMGFYAERIDRARRGAQEYYWAPSQLPCVFNLDNITDTEVVYLCQSPLIAIQMQKALSNNVVATDTLFNLQDTDLSRMADVGINTAVVVEQHRIETHNLRYLGKRLAKFGIAYQRLDSIRELRYGTA